MDFFLGVQLHFTIDRVKEIQVRHLTEYRNNEILCGKCLT